MLLSRRSLVVGVTNHRSLGWHIARELRRQRAAVTITYQHSKQERTIEKLLEEEHAESDSSLPLLNALQCDVSDGADILRLRSQFDALDVLCHAVAFASPTAMKHGLLGLPDSRAAGSLQDLEALRGAWTQAFDVSVFSLVALAREFQPILSETASITTLSYLGAERAVPGYSVMGPAKAALEATVRGLALELGASGPRVNAISAGPVDTVSARGIAGFRDLRDDAAKAVPRVRMLVFALPRLLCNVTWRISTQLSFGLLLSALDCRVRILRPRKSRESRPFCPDRSAVGSLDKSST